MRALRHLLSLVLLFAALSACDKTNTVDTPTQVTVRVISEDAALRAMMTQLRVSAALHDPGGWRAPVTDLFSASGLTWPVDVPVFPRNASDAAKQFEVVVEALQNDRVLAQARAVSGFVVGRNGIVLEVRLFLCPGHEAGFVCAQAGCQGSDCTVCAADGSCAPVESIDAGDLPGPDSRADSGMDGSTQEPTPEAGTGSDAAGDVSSPTIDAQGSAEAGADATVDAAPDAVTPMLECDDTRPCSSTGYLCNRGSCVSACTQTQCDPNATCSLNAGAPTCTCNSGFIPMRADAGAVTCIRDVACEDLACNATAATCEIGTDQLRRCVCKPGYTGDGTNCTPVSCPTLTKPPNGSVSRTTGTYQQISTYACDVGYDLSAPLTRTCEVSGQWSGGSDPSCIPKNCGSLGNPSHGTVQTSQGTTVGKSASYTCQTKYTRVGDQTRTCQTNGTWSGNQPVCLGCGDGILSTEAPINEKCEPGVAGATIWTCNPNDCQIATTYSPCVANDSPSGTPQGRGCASGELCWAFCSPQCTTDSECPSPPAGSSLVPQCLKSKSSLPVCLLTGCSSDAQCPGGMICRTPSGGVPSCVWCNESTQPCPSPLQCVQTTGNVYTASCQ